MDQKRQTPPHELKDRKVPPVKGAVSEGRDILCRPDTAFGKGVPPQLVNMPLEFDHLQ